MIVDTLTTALGVAVLACELPQYVTSAATLIASIAAAVVLVLRELRYRHPMDNPSASADLSDDASGHETPGQP